MPKRQPNIRWRQRDVEELQRTVKNFNAKLYRMQKKNPEMEAVLPPRLTVTQLKNEIATRDEYNRILESLQKFSKLRQYSRLPEADAPIQKTEWEIKHQTLRAKIANERKARRRKELADHTVKTGGKDTGVSRVAMGKVRENEGKPISENLRGKKNTAEFERATKAIDSILNRELVEKKQLLMRENYIKGLTDYGFLDDPETAKLLESYIMGVSLDTFVNTVIDDEMGSFEWYKDPQAFETRLKGLVDTWKTAYNDERSS